MNGQDGDRRRRLLIVLAALVAVALAVGIVLVATGDDSDSGDDYGKVAAELERFETDIEREVGPLESNPGIADAAKIEELKRRAEELERRLRGADAPPDQRPRVRIQIDGTHRLWLDLDALLRAVRERRIVVIRETAPRIIREVRYVRQGRPVPPPKPPGRPGAPRGGVQKLKLGQAATLNATRQDAAGLHRYTLRVTVQRVEPLSTANAPTNISDPGDKWVGLYAHLENVGNERYEGYESSDSRLTTSTGKLARREALYTGTSICTTSPSDADIVDLAPGKSTDVCVPYVLKRGETAVAARWALRPVAGRTLNEAEWSLR